jgi:hypothetical protein
MTMAVKKKAGKSEQPRTTQSSKQRRPRVPGDPITVGGGGGIVRALADYDVSIEFDDAKYRTDGNGNYSRPNFKIAHLAIEDLAGNVLANLTRLLPDDGRVSLVFRFNHVEERVYVTGNPITISFDDDLYPKAGPKRTRQTQGDRIEIDFGRGPWNTLVIRAPQPNFKISMMSVAS